MKRFGLVLMTLAVCWGGSMPASADQLYIHNQPYKGTTTGSGLQIQAQLQELVEAMGLKLTEVSSNWVITSGSETAALPEGESGSGKVYYHGKVIAEASSATALIDVNILAEATGSKLMPNKALGTVDVNRAVARIGGSSASSAGAVASKFRIIAFDAVW